jgi:hypothetical protein
MPKRSSKQNEKARDSYEKRESTTKDNKTTKPRLSPDIGVVLSLLQAN